MDDQPFTRDTLRGARTHLLHAGRWANPDLRRVEHGGQAWVIKDFGGCAWPVRQAIGRFMVRRELRALARLRGIDGVPRQPFRLDAFALCYRFEPGYDLKHAPPALFDGDYFVRLEALVQAMHARNVVHLDLRHGTNILRTDAGAPGLIDFQSMLFLDRLPRRLRALLCDVDLSGVYKEWARKHPGSLDAGRRALLERMNRRRRFWLLRGYSLFGMRRRPEGGGGTT